MTGFTYVEESFVEEEQYCITGLQYDSNIYSDGKGVFVLGCGYYKNQESTEQKYFFFQNTEYGKKLIDVYANEFYIKEEDDCKPRVVYTYKIEKRYGMAKWLLGSESNTLEAKTIIVPLDTIKINYDVDLTKGE